MTASLPFMNSLFTLLAKSVLIRLGLYILCNVSSTCSYSKEIDGLGCLSELASRTTAFKNQHSK